VETPAVHKRRRRCQKDVASSNPDRVQVFKEFAVLLFVTLSPLRVTVSKKKCFFSKDSRRLPRWQRGQVVSSPPATEETGGGYMGRDIQSLQGIGW
jgi:hypothetical protein